MILSATLYDIAVTLLILLAGLGLGMACLRLLQVTCPPIEALWLATTCGLGLLSIATLLIGLVGLLYPLVFAGLLLPLATLGIIAIARGWQDGWPTAWRWLTWRDSEPVFRAYAFALIGLSAATVVWIFLTHALMPPHEWDELAYHLTAPKLYIEAHRIVYLPSIVGSNWPLGCEMLFLIGLLLGSDIAAHLLMLSSALLTAAGLLIAARRFFDDRVGVIAVAIFFVVPLVKRLAGTGLVDLGMGMFVLAALMAFEHWQAQRRPAWLVICGALCAFAAGSKGIGGAFLILFGLLVLANAAERPLQVQPWLRSALLFGLAGGLLTLPWYARSYAFTGNPVWPFAYSIFGGRDWDPIGDQYYRQLVTEFISTPVPRNVLGTIEAFWYLLTQPEGLGGYRGGIGVIAPLGAVGAIVFVRRSSVVRRSLFICLGYYVLWFFIVYRELRYLMPIVPLLALLAAASLVWLYDRARFRLPQVAVLLVFLLLLLQEWPWASVGERGLLAARMPYLRGQVSRNAWLDTQVSSLPLMRFANTQLPPSAHILLLPYENRTYYLDRPYIVGHPYTQRLIRFEQYHSPGELAAALERMGITDVIDDPTWSYDRLPDWARIRALMTGLQQECGQVLYQQDQKMVYALRPCAATAHK